MTAPLAQQTVPVKDAVAARKRRRRAPAGGASDDCFTCAKRNIKCDRRRPYCSQCLEIGNDCSGYKTQLTWGVGVASRGKLRGLSLPIAKAPPVTREPKKSPSGRARANSTAPVVSGNWTEPEEPRSSHCGPIDIPSVSHVASLASSAPFHGSGYEYLSMSHPESTASLAHGSWGSIHYSPDLMHSPGETPKYSRFPMPLITDNLSSSVDSVSDVDYLSPLSQSYPREEMSFGSGGSSIMYDSYSTSQSSPAPQSPPSSLVLDYSRAPTSCPGLIYAPSEPSSSLTSHLDPFESHMGHRLLRHCDGLNVSQVDACCASSQPAGQTWMPSARCQEDDASSSRPGLHGKTYWTILRGPNQTQCSQDVTSRVPFFMDYYKNTMTRSMVYIDGPHNPFRDRVLHLAAQSRSLQHAICALSACNLRMKRNIGLGEAKNDSWSKLTAEIKGDVAVDDSNNDDPSLTEEFLHRDLAVQLLNEQVHDPNESTKDSVLATILLLCHYRMAESGIAKFHTQFAGVKKIIALRAERLGPSRDAIWIEALFAYFDAISASINDREAQLVPMADGPALEGGIENMVGCDGALFKTISKLGRLNLLSQSRPVQGGDGLLSRSPETQSPISSAISLFDSMCQDNLGSFRGKRSDGVDSIVKNRFDGNGFGAVLDDDEALASAMCTSTALDDNRSQFWREWKEARTALQSWHFDATTVAMNLPTTPSSTQLRDMQFLSEAFRYAALLYTERLARQSAPSGHVSFQNLVSQVVYYASSLEPESAAEKFLLWPLFIAGSECVNQLQRNMIRTKCRQIMRTSGYMNNLSALDVLEKLWAGDVQGRLDMQDPRMGAQMGRRGPFNWARCFGGPGADSEWIMF
ncbi:hypothetical protein HIM_09167 [Hirsutella minnesotensis 3608]|uniref:Zn(2)-C6 fungal-type domain-containing protein n=1 Tax=Hirsutella minnesotensis 3608 TaxID=1043627 RepID=A0A0F7ZSI9_9HYPO|nr:hypothetical protein HIM_09167 [Hirsutella minnesotensis 3608]